MRQRIGIAVCGVMVWVIPSVSVAQQLSPSAGSGAGSQAIALPLSGRTGQPGSVTATQAAVPGVTTSVNTLSPVVQVQGMLVGSRDGEALQGALTLRDAVARGLSFNLGSVNVSQFVRQARSQRTIARSALLPNLMGDLSAAVQQINLAATGFQFGDSIGGLRIPTVVGPFSFVDIRARLTQTVFDLTSLNNLRATQQTVRAAELTAEDARDLVVMAVGGTYLQAMAARARVASAKAQLDTAEALYQQARQRREVGLVALVDVDRSQIQALTQQQRLATLQNDFAKQKIALVRMIGLPPTDAVELADEIPFAPPPASTLEAAIDAARRTRADLHAAEAQVRAAERSLAAARGERMPAVSVSADYGAIGKNLAQAEGTFSIVGRVRVPIWDGGRTGAHVQQAETAVVQRRAELEDLTGQVEADVRRAWLDLQAAESQVTLAQKNVEVAREALGLTRQRFDAGVADSVEVVQAQESVVTAELDYINGVFAHNVSKLSLARAMGQADERLAEFLRLP